MGSPRDVAFSGDGRNEHGQDIAVVEPGETVVVSWLDDGHAAPIILAPILYPVPDGRCGHALGWWVCATHQLLFTNVAAQARHIHAGTHRLAWHCLDCDTVQLP